MNGIKLTVSICVATCLLYSGCSGSNVEGPPEGDVNYRQEMRDFVTDIGNYARSVNSAFIVIPQNGQELVTDTGEGNGTPVSAYLSSLDATGREGLFYGYDDDDQPASAEDFQHMLDLCLVCEQHGVEVLTTDYCFTHSKMDSSYSRNKQNGFIAFAASHRDLNNIPNYPAQPYNTNSDDISDISQAKNFLYLINGENFGTKQEFINAVSATNYDVIIMDLCFNEVMFTQTEVQQLKAKQNCGSRLVICYMSIGEAENYRFYWQNSWNSSKPQWLEAENPDWAGNYKVRYWYPEWQAIIFGNSNSYLDRILSAGFDGVYLDIVDAFENYENL